MKRMWFAAVLLAGCPACSGNDEPGEGDHLIVHVVSDVQFDHVDVTLVDIGHIEDHIQLPGPTSTYDYDFWADFNGTGPRHVRLTAQYHGTTIGGGEATNIEYRPFGDGSYLAKITMHLTQ